MAALVYLLCAGTALIWCILLYRGYRRSHVSLLFWSALCFAGLTADNFFLFFDRIVFADVEMTLYRRPVALISVCLLLYGMIFKSK
jgi:hypothetical protein